MSATPAHSHRLLVLGGTGLVGREVVTAALSNDAISAVLSFGRKPPPVDPSVAGFSKLQHTALDFEALLAEKEAGPETQKLRTADADSVVVALGTTRATAGSAENFERIDRLYVLKAAEAARTSKPQMLAYVSVRENRFAPACAKSRVKEARAKLTKPLLLAAHSLGAQMPRRGSCTPSLRGSPRRASRGLAIPPPSRFAPEF